MRHWLSPGVRLPTAALFGLACVLAFGSACRSVSVEIGTLATGPTPVPASSTAASGQQIAFSAELAKAPTPTVMAPVSGNTEAPSGLSFAPRGVQGSGSGTITNQQQRDAYPFQGVQGQLLEVRAKRTSGVTLQPRIEVLDPSGAAEVSQSFANGPEVLVERKLASTGGYTIAISAFQGAGPYSVAWSLDRFGQLANGGQVNAELADPGQKDRFRFEARQGQLLTASVQRTSGVSLQPWLELVDPTGAKESGADGYGRDRVTLEKQLASSGTYLLVVAGQNTGPYQVTLSLR